MEWVHVPRPEEPLIDSSRCKKIHYQSSNFLNGLKKINEDIKKLLENKQPDQEKLYESFDI